MMKDSYKLGFILIKDRTDREKLRKSSSVLVWCTVVLVFFIVIRHQNKNPMDRDFPFSWPAVHHHSDFSGEVHSG